MSRLFIFTIALLLSNQGHANIDETLQVKYSDDTELQLGVGVDEFEPSKARQFCLEFTSVDVIKDVNGSTAAQINTRGLSKISDFENDFNFDYSVETTANAGVDKLFKVDSTLKNTGKFALYLKNYRTNFGIIVDATAKHGSERVLYSKGLKEKFQKLLDEGNYEEFRNKCGTHFVSSRTIISELSVIINASNLSRTLKNTVNQTWSASFGASGSFDGLTAGATAKSTTTVSNLLTIMKKHGEITHDIKSRGGKGIGSIGSILASSSYKPEDIQEIYKSIAKAAEDFTVENAVPETFNLISYEIFGAKPPTVDTVTFRQLEKIYKKVVRIDAAVDIYKNYKNNRPTLHKKYFKPIHDSLLIIRAQLVSRYKECRAGGKCLLPSTIELEDLIFLEDIFINSEFGVSCIQGHDLLDIAGKRRNFLSSADFIVSGKIQFLEELDLDLIQITRNIKDDDFEAISFDPSARLKLFNKQGDKADVIIQIDTLQIPKNAIIDSGEFVDLSKIVGIRASFRENAYIIRFGLKNGLHVDEVFALPNLKSCTISENGK